MMAAAEKKNPTVATQQKQLEALIVPKIDFRDASLGSTLDFLKQSASKLSEGKLPSILCSRFQRSRSRRPSR